MSLLMQALKKAERARQSGLQEEDLPERADAAEPLEFDTAPPADVPRQATPAQRSAAHVPSELKLEPLSLEPLSLEPLDQDAPPARSAGADPTPAAGAVPPIEAAREAVHDPVPPQARHEPPRARPEARTDAAVPLAEPRGAPRPAGETPNPRGPGAPERRAVPRTQRERPAASAGVDMSRLRIGILSGVLVLILGAFAYLYRQALTGPGPGASLPMVPMPPPSATGATTAGGTSGIVVAPPGAGYAPPAGAPVAVPESNQPAAATPLAAAAPAPAAAAAPATAAAPAPAPVATTTPAPAAAIAPAAAYTPAPADVGPTPEQLAAIADPEVRREAMRDAAERAMRNQARGIAPGSAAVPAGPAPESAAAPVAGTPASGEMRVARGTAQRSVDPAVQRGYAALQAGDLAAARQHYDAALQAEPNNRDALLGRAALAQRERRDADAYDAYARLLALNPRDPEALAGIVALRPGDGEEGEVRLKGALRANPEAAPVHFALGNLYARQRRWQEAQQAYFRAWSAAPGNADYAFNLAIGLDRLGQPKLAREYYQRALALATGGPAAFDRAAAQRRLDELSAPPPSAPAAAAAPAAPALPGAGN